MSARYSESAPLAAGAVHRGGGCGLCARDPNRSEIAARAVDLWFYHLAVCVGRRTDLSGTGNPGLPTAGAMVLLDLHGALAILGAIAAAHDRACHMEYRPSGVFG